MMVAITTLLSPSPASGNTTTDGSEQVLASTANLSAGKIFEFRINTANMGDGDAIEIRIYTKANGNDVESQCWFATFAHAQSDKIKRSIPVAVEAGGDYKVTLKRVAGTDRAYQWSVLEF